jgi:hypothetical protein
MTTDYVEIVNIVVDRDRVEWMCGSCFCKSGGCHGKTIVRLKSKEELEG